MLTITIETARRFILGKQGLWPGRRGLGNDEAFAEAWAGGLARFVRFLGASKLDAKAIHEPLLRRRACSSQEATGGEA
jgi:uncharacterized protein